MKKAILSAIITLCIFGFIAVVVVAVFVILVIVIAVIVIVVVVTAAFTGQARGI